MKEEEKKRLVEEQMARALRDNENRRLMQEAQIEPPKPRREEETEIQVNCEQDDHWKKIIANYKKKFPEEVRNNQGFIFPSVESAVKFFTKQALKGYEFLGTWVKDGKRTDDHLFSCGNGKLYTGSFIKIHQDLQDALKAETDPDKKAMITKGIERIKNNMPNELNPAAEMRNKLQESKKAADTSENIANKSENLSEEQNSAITPFAKAPNPFK